MAPRGSGFLEEHFTLSVATRTAKTGKDWKCKYCDYLGKAWYGPARGKAHLAGQGGCGVAACPKVPEEIKQAMLRELEENTKKKLHRLQSQEKLKELNEKKHAAEGLPDGASAAKQPKIVDMQKRLKEDLDLAFAEFAFHSGIPFHITEDVMLRKWLEKVVACVLAGLRSVYPPELHILLDKWVDIVYQKVGSEIPAVFASDHHLNLTTDGYSNVRRDSVINYTLVGRKGAVFVKAEYPGKAIKDSQRIADSIHSALDCIRKLELPCPTSTVISDNASVMQSALGLLDTNQKYAADHYLTKVGCCIHAYNLLYKDISNLPSVKKPTESGRVILRFFRGRFHAAGILRDEQTKHGLPVTSPPLCGETRFAPNYPCMRWLQKNNSALQSAVVNPDWVATRWNVSSAESVRAEDVVNLVLSGDFWGALDNAQALLKPLAEMIRRADTEGPSYTGLVYHDMSHLQQHVMSFQGITKVALKRVKELVSERWKLLHVPVHSAAYCFNHQIMSPDMDPLSEKEILDDLNKVFQGFVGQENVAQARLQYQSFLMRSGEFSELALWEGGGLTMSSLMWWQTFCYDNAILRECALRVCSVVSVASSAERNWSLFGFIHSWARNRLYAGKAEKLVYIYNNMRMLRKVRNADFQEPCDLPYDSDSDEEDSVQ